MILFNFKMTLLFSSFGKPDFVLSNWNQETSICIQVVRLAPNGCRFLQPKCQRSDAPIAADHFSSISRDVPQPLLISMTEGCTALLYPRKTTKRTRHWFQEHGGIIVAPSGWLSLAFCCTLATLRMSESQDRDWPQPSSIPPFYQSFLLSFPTGSVQLRRQRVRAWRLRADVGSVLL